MADLWLALLLQGAGVPLQELDWMVCNGGADIWHLLQAGGGKDPKWSSDEHWDAHITFRQAPCLCTPFRPSLYRRGVLVQKRQHAIPFNCILLTRCYILCM